MPPGGAAALQALARSLRRDRTAEQRRRANEARASARASARAAQRISKAATAREEKHARSVGIALARGLAEQAARAIPDERVDLVSLHKRFRRPGLPSELDDWRTPTPIVVVAADVGAGPEVA